MKLNSQSQLGLNITPQVVDNIVSCQWDNYISKCPDLELKEKAFNQFYDVFSDECKRGSSIDRILKDPTSGVKINQYERFQNQNYIIAKTATEMAKKIKIDEDKFDVRFLNKIKDKKITFLLGNDLFIRYIKRGDEIMAIRVTTTPVAGGIAYMNYLSFKINTATGYISHVNNPDQPFADPQFKLFVQLLVFTELSKLEIKILAPREKFGTRKVGKFINESAHKITVIDSVWNTISVRNIGFGVSGHWRFQRCGKDFSEVEYIFIEPFRKKGYVRGAKKETSSESV